MTSVCLGRLRLQPPTTHHRSNSQIVLAKILSHLRATEQDTGTSSARVLLRPFQTLKEEGLVSSSVPKKTRWKELFENDQPPCLSRVSFRFLLACSVLWVFWVYFEIGNCSGFDSPWQKCPLLKHVRPPTTLRNTML